MNADYQPGQAMEQAGPVSPAEADFQKLCCAKFGCPPRHYARRVFRECVFPEGRFLARLLRLIAPGFFQADFELIDQIKHAANYAEVKQQVDFHGLKHAPSGFLRLILRVRLSKSRLQNLAQSLFDEPG
jgi:hypothetical protein